MSDPFNNPTIYTIYYSEDNVLKEGYQGTSIALYRKLVMLNASAVLFGCAEPVPYDLRRGFPFILFNAWLQMHHESDTHAIVFGFNETKFYVEEIALNSLA